MRFTKMHGLGNDYVYVDLFQERVEDAPALARAVSDRHRGIGSDGLILIGPSEAADVRMIMYNADGSRGEMCGNGLRCVAKYAFEHGLSPRTDVRIETDAGVRTAECHVRGGRVMSVRAQMGVPSFVPDPSPCFQPGREVVDESLRIHGREFRGTFVSVGSPHWVVFAGAGVEFDLHRDGPAIERHEAFPRRVNVHFARVDSPGEIAMVSWERGTGSTQACGSGACSVAAAAERLGHTSFPVTLRLPGGDLLIEREAETLFMTGPAEEVFSGDWPTA